MWYGDIKNFTMTHNALKQ